MTSPDTLPAGRRAAYACSLILLSLAAMEFAAWAARPFYAKPAAELDDEARSLASIGLERDEIGRLPSSIRFNVVGNALTEPHPRLMFHVRPNPTGREIPVYTGINAQGYRGAEFSPTTADADAKRVMILGDSCAFGWKITEYEDTFQAGLERRLRASGGRWEVYNFAQPGYSSAQGRLLFEDWFARIAPDVVVAYFGWNDLRARTYLSDRQYLETLRYLNHPAIRIVRRTNVYAALEALLRRGREPLAVRYATPDADNRRVPLVESVANFEAFAREVAASGGELVVILPPHAGPHVDAVYQRRIAEQNDAVARALEGRATLLALDRMRPDAPGATAYFDFDGYHPNPRGADYIAEQLFEAIRTPR